MLASGSTVSRNRKKEGVDMGGKTNYFKTTFNFKNREFFFTYY